MLLNWYNVTIIFTLLFKNRRDFLRLIAGRRRDEKLRRWRINSWKKEKPLKVLHFPAIQETGNKQNIKQLNYLH